MQPFYKPELIGVDGETLLVIDDAISVVAARSFNTDGSCTLIIPDYYQRDYFRMHTRMLLWRHDYDGVPRSFGRTVWFLKKIDHDHDDQSLSLSFVDTFAMLKGRLVGYTADGTYANKTMEEYQVFTYIELLRIANMMRAYVRENVGAEALDPRRTIPSIVVEEDRPEGPFGEKQASFQELGATLTDLAHMAEAKGTPLFYDLLPISGGRFLFKVWSDIYGIDRSEDSTNPLLLTEDSGFLTEIHEVEDYSNVASFCWALGEGSGGSQLLETGENLTVSRSDPFGRIEMTVTASDTSNITVLADTAITALAGRLPKRTLACRVVENSALVFQKDLDYGDKLMVQVGPNQYNCVLNAIATNWQDGEEDLTLRLAGEVPLGSAAIYQTIIIPDPPPDPGPDNQAPVVDAGDDQTLSILFAALLEGEVTDDGLPDPPAALTYLWTKTSGPDVVNFGTPTLIDTNATFDGPGVYVLRLTASDSELTGFDEVTITVEEEPEPENEAPVVDAGDDQTINIILAALLEGEASDDGLPDPPASLTYLWTVTSGPDTVNFGTPTLLSTNATFDSPGTYVLRLTVSDSDLSSFDELTVTVEP